MLRVRFTVDNRQCAQPVVVYLDGIKLGKVPGKTLVDLKASEGKHTLCLSREDEKTPCKSPASRLNVTVYEGFAIRPRC